MPSGKGFTPEKMSPVGHVGGGLRNGCPSSPYLKATQVNLSLCDSDAHGATVPTLEPRMGESLCIVPLK